MTKVEALAQPRLQPHLAITRGAREMLIFVLMVRVRRRRRWRWGWSFCCPGVGEGRLTLMKRCAQRPSGPFAGSTLSILHWVPRAIAYIGPFPSWFGRGRRVRPWARPPFACNRQGHGEAASPRSGRRPERVATPVSHSGKEKNKQEGEENKRKRKWKVKFLFKSVQIISHRVFSILDNNFCSKLIRWTRSTKHKNI